MSDTANYQFELLDKTVEYQGFFAMHRYRVKHTLFRGGWSAELVREIFERGHAVAVLPYDPQRDELVLIEQFRPGALEAPGGPWLIEVVAGMIETGESTEEVAYRETFEEAGLNIMALQPIYEFLLTPGGSTERIMLYLAQVNAQETQRFHGLSTEHEDIQVHVLPTATALAWLAQGRIRSAVPLIALQWFALHYQEIRAQWGYPA